MRTTLCTCSADCNPLRRYDLPIFLLYQLYSYLNQINPPCSAPVCILNKLIKGEISSLWFQPRALWLTARHWANAKKKVMWSPIAPTLGDHSCPCKGEMTGAAEATPETKGAYSNFTVSEKCYSLRPMKEVSICVWAGPGYLSPSNIRFSILCVLLYI